MLIMQKLILLIDFPKMNLKDKCLSILQSVIRLSKFTHLLEQPPFLLLNCIAILYFIISNNRFIANVLCKNDMIYDRRACSPRFINHWRYWKKIEIWSQQQRQLNIRKCVPNTLFAGQMHFIFLNNSTFDELYIYRN